MTTLKFTYPPGATPLDPDELAGLIPDFITTHGELNELEQKNIQEATLWLRDRRVLDICDPALAYALHKQMFNQVWKWAGRPRTSGKNIGIDWPLIATQLVELLRDTKIWIAERVFPIDEIAARFHHRLVQIHVFPNGNGRHARLMTDLLLELNGQKVFTWGNRTSREPLETEGARRDEYISALRAADRNDFGPLIAFVRS